MDSHTEVETVREQREHIARDRPAVLQRSDALASPQESQLLHDKPKNLDEPDSKSKNESSPILCLPNEITCHIFEMTCIQSESHYDHPHYELWPQNLEQRPEITVSRVCQHWRQVALSCSTIWSHIVIRRWYAGQAFSSVQRLLVYLTRSQGALLDIVATITTPPYAQETVDCSETLRELLLVILPHSTRWQRLVIWMECKWKLFPLSILSKIAVPQLEVFEIGSWPTWDPLIPSASSVSDTLTLFELGAPRLASVLSPASLRLHHQCRNISTVYLQRGKVPRPWEEFVSLMSLPSLTNLTLDGDIFRAPDLQDDTTRIVVQNLRHCRLGCRTVFKYMWDTLLAPQLEFLLLFGLWWPRIDDTLSVSPRSLFPALKTLALWHFELADPQDLLHIAWATPHVEELTVCACIPDGKFMMSLYEQSLAKNTRLWPRLQAFSYVLSHDHWFTGDLEPKEYSYKAVRKALMKFVDWRLETFGCDCNFWIDYPDYSSEQAQNTRRDDPFFYIPEFDDSEEERALWMEHLIPLSRRVLPWPDEQNIRFGFHEKIGFGNVYVRNREY